ncbi:hypothetical protein JCM5353_003726 [Sporobolomyces roseus]
MAHNNDKARTSYPPTNLITSRNSVITNNKSKSLPSLRAIVSTDPPPPNGADGRSVSFARSMVTGTTYSSQPRPSTKMPLSCGKLSTVSSGSANQDSHLSIPTPFALPQPSTTRSYILVPPQLSLSRSVNPPSNRELAPPPPSPSPSSKSDIPAPLVKPAPLLNQLELPSLGPLPEKVRVLDQDFSFKVGTKYLGTDRSAWLNLAKKACFDHGFNLIIRKSSKDDSRKIQLSCGNSRKTACPFQFELQPKRLTSQKIEYTVIRFTNEHDHPKLSYKDLVPPKLSADPSATINDEDANERRKRRKPERYGQAEGAVEQGDKRQDEVSESSESEDDYGNESEIDELEDMSEVERDQTGGFGGRGSDEGDVADSQGSKVPSARHDDSISARPPRIRYKPDFSSCENDITKIKELVRQGTGFIPWAIGGGGPYNVYRCKYGTANGSKGRSGPRCQWMLVRDDLESKKGEWTIDEDASHWYHNHTLSPLSVAVISVSSVEDEASPPPAPVAAATQRKGKPNVIWLLDSDDEDVKPSPSNTDKASDNRLSKQPRIAPAPIPSAGILPSSHPLTTPSTSTAQHSTPQRAATSDDTSLEMFLLDLGLGKHEGENDFMFPLLVDNSETWHTLDFLASSFRASKTFNTPTRIEKAQSRMLLQSLRLAFEPLRIGMIEEGWWKLIGDALGSGYVHLLWKATSVPMASIPFSPGSDRPLPTAQTSNSSLDSYISAASVNLLKPIAATRRVQKTYSSRSRRTVNGSDAQGSKENADITESKSPPRAQASRSWDLIVTPSTKQHAHSSHRVEREEKVGRELNGNGENFALPKTLSLSDNAQLNPPPLKKFKRDSTDTNKLLTETRIDGVAGQERDRLGRRGSSSGKEKEKELVEVKPKVEDEGLTLLEISITKLRGVPRSSCPSPELPPELENGPINRQGRSIKQDEADWEEAGVFPMLKRFKVQNLSEDLARATSRAISTSARVTPKPSASLVNSRQLKNSESASDRSGKGATRIDSSAVQAETGFVMPFAIPTTNSSLGSSSGPSSAALASPSNSSLSPSSLEAELLKLGEDFTFYPRHSQNLRCFDFLAPLLREAGYDRGQDLTVLRVEEAGDIIVTLREYYENKGSVEGIVAEIDWVRMRNQLRKGLRKDAGVS